MFLITGDHALFQTSVNPEEILLVLSKILSLNRAISALKRSLPEHTSVQCIP